MAALPKTTKTFRIDSATLVRYTEMAGKDNRTLNNLVETVLMWAEQQPDLLTKLKSCRKRKTLGAIMDEVYEMRKTLGRPQPREVANADRT